MPEMLLARLGACGFRPGARPSLQQHPGAPVLPQPVLPELHQGARGGCPGGAGGHTAPVLCWSHRALLVPRGPALPPRSIRGAAGIAACRRVPGNRGHMLLFHATETPPARLPAQPQAGGRGAHRPGAPGTSPSAPWGAWLPPFQLWAPTGGLSSGGPWDGTDIPQQHASRESREQLPSPAMCRDPAWPWHPPSAFSTHGRGAGVEGSLMDIHEQRVC